VRSEAREGGVVRDLFVDSSDVATCNGCRRSWDVERHPTPAYLCPFCNGDERAGKVWEVERTREGWVYRHRVRALMIERYGPVDALERERAVRRGL
jgi:ribosomal protein L37AE/L43A